MSTQNPEHPVSNGVDSSNTFPKMVSEDCFEEILTKELGKKVKVLKINPISAFGAGENYASNLLRVEVEYELEDKSHKTTSYIYKGMPLSPFGIDMIQKLDIFPKEIELYESIIPQFEDLFRKAGKDITFGPKCWKASQDKDAFIMEDLKIKKFVNAKRQDGLNMEHMKCSLRKLAEFHAASAVLYEEKGYAEHFMTGIFNESVRDIFEAMNKPLAKIYQTCLEQNEKLRPYLEKIAKYQETLLDKFMNDMKVKPNEFNVLNHGDLWCNNIMFKYDKNGTVEETYFVDYSILKYGSPAQDLWYFLLSSAAYDIKLQNFDFFIKYYYDNLCENLELLKYPKKLPKLVDIHLAILKNGFWALGTTAGVLAIVLLDPTELATMENFIDESAAGMEFKKLSFLNPRYVKALEAILPWLNNKGLLDV